MKEKLLKISDIKVNKELYPRTNVDFVTVSRYINALKAGAVFPPITVGVLDKKLWLIDGMHRIEANKANGQKFIQAEVMEVADEKQLYLESVKRNISHGKQFNTFEVTRIIVKLEDFQLSQTEISQMVGLSVDKLQPFIAKRMTQIIGGVNNGQLTVLKKPLTYLSDDNMGISELNIEMQKNLKGNSQEIMVKNLINLIKNDLVNPTIKKPLRTLYLLLKPMFEDREIIAKVTKKAKKKK